MSQRLSKIKLDNYSHNRKILAFLHIYRTIWVSDWHLSLVNNSVVFVTTPPPDSDERSLDERSSFVVQPLLLCADRAAATLRITRITNLIQSKRDGHNQGSTLGKIRQQNAQFYNRFTETLGHLWWIWWVEWLNWIKMWRQTCQHLKKIFCV